jgi:hypothetical protein
MIPAFPPVPLCLSLAGQTDGGQKARNNAVDIVALAMMNLPWMMYLKLMIDFGELAERLTDSPGANQNSERSELARRVEGRSPE